MGGGLVYGLWSMVRGYRTNDVIFGYAWVIPDYFTS